MSGTRKTKSEALIRAAKAPPKFPEGCAVIKIEEFAKFWGVSSSHVLNMIEQGEILAVDISGNGANVRIHAEAIPEIARTAKLPVQKIWEIIERAAILKPRRSVWRIVREGYDEFIKEKASLPPGTPAKLAIPKIPKAKNESVDRHSR